MANEKTKTVADDMRQRRTFYPEAEASALESATSYLAKCMDDFDDFDSYPVVAPGMSADEEGNTVFDPDVYSDSVGVIVGVLKKKGEGVKCIFMAPIPNLPALVTTEDEAAHSWAVGILEKEANHVAVRHLRDADDLEDARNQMPHSVEAYTTSSRGVTSGIMQAFDDLYKNISQTIGSKVGAWSRARLNKSDLRRALESSAYAREYYAALEERGDSPSLFVIALDLGIRAAKEKGLDPTIFERWKATRDEKPFTATEDDEDDFDLDSLTSTLLGEAEEGEEGDSSAAE